MPVKNRQELKVLKGGLEVQLTLIPLFLETGERFVPSQSEIEIWMREEGIVAAFDAKAIQFAIHKAQEGLKAEVVAAKGIPPNPGKDGYLEYLIDFNASVAPTIINTGKIDLRTSLIRNVQAGDPLAVVHAPAEGALGIDVLGKILAAPMGHICNPRLGKNVARSQSDPSLIVAKVSGHACLIDKVLDVQEFYLVDRDVDYNTGNITFKKSVLIRGDVKAGFSVNAGGDLEITGLVEDCQINSNGKIYIKGGFTGQGKGIVESSDDITIGYIRNQRVKCEKEIVVLKEAVNAQLQSCHSIKVNGLLAGGNIQARYSIQCLVSGTETGTPTHLEVGADFAIDEEMMRIHTEMENMGRYSKKLGDSLKQIQDLEKLNRTLEPWTIELLFEMESSRNKVETKTRALQNRFAILEKQVSNLDKATVTIHQKINAGTRIKMGKDVYLVNETLRGPKTFFAKDGIVHIR